MALHCTLHLNFVTIVRSQEIRTNQEKDDSCHLEMLVDFLRPRLSSKYLPMMPGVNESLSLKQTEVLL